MLGLLMILISKFWGCISKSWGCPPRVGHAFPRHQHMRKGRQGYLFLSGFPSLYDAIYGWMGHVKKLHEKRPQHLLLYVMIYHQVGYITKLMGIFF
jgi:hypothetical protein